MSMRARIPPCRPEGTAEAPPSKSMAHRLLICAALSRGTSFIGRVGAGAGADLSGDIQATVDCLRVLGASVVREGDGFRVTGCDPREPSSPPRLREFDCRECGSTLRFLFPLGLLSGEPALFRGSDSLLGRPLSVYEQICRERGIRFERREDGVFAEGRLTPGEYRIPGDVSSQFASGLLFALPLLPGDSVIRLIPPAESRPYVDMTVWVLTESGIGVRLRTEEDGGLTLYVPGRSEYLPRSVPSPSVEGDWTNAAVFDALNFVGGNVRVSGLSPDSPQGDRIYPDYFRRLKKGPAVLDVSDCPDLAPVLFCVAAVCHGGTFTGTRRLRFKESDRCAAMAEELAKFGIRTRSESEADAGEDSFTVFPGPVRAPEVPLRSHNDHRIVMALSVLCVLTGGTIDGAEAVRKSFPDFWDRLRALGVDVQLREEEEQ